MLPSEDFHSQGLSGFVTQLTEFLIGLGSRLLVHFSSLILAAIIGSAMHLPAAGFAASGALIFCLYIGLICLVPRGIAPRPDWLVPTGAGLLLVIIWGVTGFPWQFAVIWGGALTWTVRLLMKRGMMDWEWSAIPALLIGMFCFFDALLPLARTSPPYPLFPLLAAGAWGVILVCGKLFGDTVQAGALKEACARLERLAADKRLPRELWPGISELAAQGRELLRLKPRLDQSTADLTRTLDQTSAKLARLGPKLTAEGTIKVRAQLERMNRVMDDRLSDLAPPEPETPERAEARALAARLEGFHTQIRQLADKRYTLPLELQQHVDGIALAADKIIGCMREDPNDVARGDRFLSRYLKSAHTVIDEYMRLSERGGQYAQVAEALEKARTLLARMEAAFNDEHAALLRNDTVNFTAELNVLDKLLKMDGK